MIGGGIQLIASRYAFVVGRGIIGIAFGINNAVSPMFITEIAPLNLRGYCVPMVQIWMTLGLLSPLLMNFMVPFFQQPFSGVEDYCKDIEGVHIIWREIFMLPIILAFIQLSCLLFIFRRENPIYLEHHRVLSESSSEDQGRDSSCTESSLAQSLHYDIQQSFRRPLTRQERDTWKLFKNQGERRKLYAGIIVRVVTQLLGIDNILHYAYSFRITEAKTQYNFRLFITMLSPFYTIIAMFLVSNYKRRKLLSIGTLISCVSSCLLFQLSGSVEIRGLSILMFQGTANILSTVSIFIFTINFWLTTASTIFIYCGEILTDKGMAISTAVHWFLNALVEFLPIFAFLIVEWTGTFILFHDANAIFFFVFSGNAILGFFLVTTYVRETFKRSKKEIDEDFGHDSYDFFASATSNKNLI